MCSALMTRYAKTACLSVALLLGGAVAEAGVIAPGSTVAGKTIGDWTAEWWKWAFAQSVPKDAFTDSTGANANVNQSGPVFFVAGTTGGPATRAFTVPSDKYLLIPLVNYEDSLLEQTILASPNPPNITPAELQKAVKDIADLFDILFAEIDGIPVSDLDGLKKYREASPEFNWVGAVNNPFVRPDYEPVGDSGFAYADGYWLMLEPLGKGTTTTIEFGGGATVIPFETRITATITGVPEPGTLALIAIGLLPGAALFFRKKCSAG